MVFLLEIANVWQKSRDFWFENFFHENFKIHWLVWIFLSITVFLMCFIIFLPEVINNLKFYKRCFIKEDLLKKLFCTIE